jgi:hypothetical protein
MPALVDYLGNLLNPTVVAPSLVVLLLDFLCHHALPLGQLLPWIGL